MNKINYFLLAALAIAIGVAGYFAGKSGNEPSARPIQSNQPQVEQVIPSTPNTETPQKPATSSETPKKPATTSESLAKAKNVPATLSDPQGDYTLVAVVEGIDANSNLDHSIQVVSDQRQRLAALSQQLDKTPAEPAKQRELIAGQVKNVKKALEYNLRIMSQNYAYSLKNNHVRIPHEASLLLVTKVDGKTKTEKVHAFENAKDYDDFVERLDVYLRMKREQAKAAKAAKNDAVPVPESNPVEGQDTKLAPTLEMNVKSQELLQLYNYDTEKTYKIRLEKTALYARAARAGQTDPTKVKPTNANTPKKRVITPESIAKAKNVPATLNKPEGVYTLVAVIEGTESNRQLNQGFKVVSAQRQRLAVLSRQFEKIPIASVQQRELVASQINKTNKELDFNLRLMAQRYGYSLKNKYVTVPHVASLSSITKVGGEAKAETVHVFKTSGDYEGFQKKREAYFRLKQTIAQAARVTHKNAKLVPTPAMKEMQKELIKLYKYDPEKNYQIDSQKSALYARPSR